MPVEYSAQTLVFVLDLAGTFVFAVSGALAAIERKLDAFGVLVLALATALSGGIIRDVLIGAVPPRGISEWSYPATALLAGAVTFFLHRSIRRMQRWVLILDAGGLALFAVAGAHKALGFGLNPLMAALMGVLTAVGGGTVGDILLAQVPRILRVEVYAVAALIGAAIVVAGHEAGLPATPVALVAAATCFVMRLVSKRRGWNAPVAGAE